MYACTFSHIHIHIHSHIHRHRHRHNTCRHTPAHSCIHVLVHMHDAYHIHVRMSAYIGKKTYQKYMHLCLWRAHEFVHTHAPTYNLRHSARKHFNAQIHTHRYTHIQTQACMPAYIHTRLTTLETLPARAQKV